MCSGAIIKSGITEVLYAAPHEDGSSPDIYLREINEKATPKLTRRGGFMRDKFFEQIKRGRDKLPKNSFLFSFYLTGGFRVGIDAPFKKLTLQNKTTVWYLLTRTALRK